MQAVLTIQPDTVRNGNVCSLFINIKMEYENEKIPGLLILALIFGISTVAAAADNYSRTIKVFRDSPALAKFFKHSNGYAVFPIIGKAGYIIGGSYGVGQIYRGNKVTGKSTVIERCLLYDYQSDSSRAAKLSAKSSSSRISGLLMNSPPAISNSEPLPRR